MEGYVWATDRTTKPPTKVPSNAPDTLYYHCGNHDKMGGKFVIVDNPISTLTAAEEIKYANEHYSEQNIRSFYNYVFELFEHYEKELDLNYYTIKYENLVSHFEKEIKILLNFIGLEYEKELENFYSTAKSRVKISTPSYNQVINPLYSSSIGRWKNYKDINNPEQRLIKWIKKFNY